MGTKIQLRRDIAKNWRLNNPILASGEPGVETDTGFVKFGDGIKAFNQLPYASQAITESTLISMNVIPEPGIPNSNQLSIYAKQTVNKINLAIKSPSGFDTIFQTQLGGSFIQLAQSNGSANFTFLGCSWSGAGTLSNLSPSSIYSQSTLYSTSATINNSAYGYPSSTSFMRGEKGKPGGFYYRARIQLPDASYDSSGVASTGSRVAFGMGPFSAGGGITSDLINGSAYIMFKRVSNGITTLHNNWQLRTCDGTTNVTSIDTGLAFLGQSQYFLELFAPTGADKVYWRITNETTGDDRNGFVNTNLPPIYTLMRPYHSLITLNAVARKFGITTMYCESDR